MTRPLILSLSKGALLAALAAALILSPSKGFADTARTSARLPVFDRPSSNAELLGRIDAGARVEVIECTGPMEWCLVGDPGDGGPIGWVRAGYLIGVGAIQKASPFEFLVNPSLEDLGVETGE